MTTKPMTSKLATYLLFVGVLLYVQFTYCAAYPAFPDAPPPPPRATATPPEPEYALTIVKVVDGDTIRADVALGFGVVLANQSVRLQGYDTWEVSRRRRTVTITDEELVKGKVATDALTALLARHKGRIRLRPKGKGRGVYGRLEGWLYVYPHRGERIDLAAWMRERGHQREEPENAE